MPYRSRTHTHAPQATETGLVADMVRQFADPFAFVRELVQNGIDAGATELHVGADLRADAVTLTVRDDGDGMTRDVIEGPLLTLFNSAKDDQEGKIGKYGIGFVSVFAIRPDEVIVDTWRAEGSWQLTLRPDHSFELAVGRDRPGSGTLVTLVCRSSGDRDDPTADFPARTRASLLGWCRHAELPIHWSQRQRDGTETRERIDRPLDVDSVIAVRTQAGGAHIVLGPTGSDKSFIGFYNRGLTLHESVQPLHDRLAGLEVKIMSPDLQHTLSRDNVRRDRAYDRAVDAAVDLARRELRELAANELRASAERVARGGDPERYGELLRVAVRAPIQLRRSELTLALTDSIDGAMTRTADACQWRGIVPMAKQPSVVTQALAREDVAVVASPTDIVRVYLSMTFRHALCDVHKLFTVASPVRQTELEDALCAATLRALTAADVRVNTVELRHMDGVPARAAVPEADGDLLLIERTAWPNWYRRLGAADVRLIRGHVAVSRALDLARTNLPLASALLARYLIVEQRGELGASASDALLAASFSAGES